MELPIYDSGNDVALPPHCVVTGYIEERVGVNTMGHPPTLTLGYAVVSADARHRAANGRDASFGLDPRHA